MKKKIKDLLEEFLTLDVWRDKCEFIIKLKLPRMRKADKIERNKVKGCVSSVWILNNNKNCFNADSNTNIVKGLLFIIIKIYYRLDMERIKKINVYNILNMMKLSNELTISKNNGIKKIIQAILLIAQKE